MPVANTGDGVATNKKASRLLSICYGLETPSFHCATHASDLVMKRMATSKTISVPEVVVAYDTLRPVIKYFESSTKSKEKLDEAISILNIQQIRLISWGGTRMAHFVKACHRFSKLLPAVYDAMYSTDIKKEERDALFTVQNIYVLILLSDLKPFFKDNLLRKMDKDVLLASTVYCKAIKSAENFTQVETLKADEFVDNIFLDVNVNLNGKLNLKGSEHTITFNRQSRNRRNISQDDDLKKIQNQLRKIKLDVLKNADENLRGLVGKEDTCFFMWSALDLEDK